MSLRLPSVQLRNAGTRFVALAGTAAALVAIALTTFSPAPPHAGAQEQTTFETNFSVRVPFVDLGEGDNNLGDITISVTYTPVAAPTQEQGCTPSAMETFTIARAGDNAGSGFAGGGVTPQATRQSLVNTPENSSTPCRYVANFADSFSHATHGTFDVVVGDETEFDAGDFADDGFLHVAYSQDQAVFFPNVEIWVLQINDATDDPATGDRDETELNYFRNTYFPLTIAPVTGAPSGCTQTTSGNAGFLVQESGHVSASPVTDGGRGLYLVDVPAGAAAGEFCEYTVTLPASRNSSSSAREAFTLTRLGTATANIDRDNPNALREYRRPEATRFTTTFDIQSDDLEELVDGVQWDIDIRPATFPAQHEHCSPARTLRLRTGAYGASSGTAELPVTLVRRPIGANADGSQDCSYDAFWPRHEVGGDEYRRSESDNNPSAVVEHGIEFASARYVRVPPEAEPFAPSIAITVPQLEGTTAGRNFLTGHYFEVRVRRDDTSNSIPRCSLQSLLGLRMQVGSDGNVGGDLSLPGELIGTTAQGEACGYTVEFPGSIAIVGSRTLRYTLTRVTETAPLNGDATLASGSYTVGEITFAPDSFSIAVPARGHTGKQISATFTGSRAACPNQTHIYHTDRGSVTPDGANAALVAYPAGATTTSEMCIYDVEFSANELGGDNTLELQPGPTMRVSHQSLRLEASYAEPPMATTFMPVISVEVPQLEGTTSGANAFAGTTFDVELVRAGGAHPDCSLDANRPVQVTYTVRIDGRVTTTDSDLPTSLTDTLLDGTTTCAYDVFPPTAQSASGAELMWRLEAASGRLSGTSRSVTLTYSVSMSSTPGAVTFDPDATIGVPSGNAGVSFGVQFASAQTGCSGNPTAQTLRWVVQPDGQTVLPDGDNESLVAYPVGAMSVSDLCSYTVTFSMNESGAATLERQAFPAPTATVTGVAQAISASYAAVSTGGTSPVVPGQPQSPAQPQSSAQPQSPAQPRSSGGRTSGGGGGGRTGGTGVGSGGGSSIAATGPFVPSATQRVPVGVSLVLPADAFSAPTPVEVLVNAPGDCGTDVATFDGLAAQIGVTYAFDAAASTPAGEPASGAAGEPASRTAEIIAAGARHLAQFAERGTQQRPCALRVTLLSAPAGCTLRADASTAAGSTAADSATPGVDPAAPVLTDDAGRSYVELTFSDGDTTLNLIPALACTPEPT